VRRRLASATVGGAVASITMRPISDAFLLTMAEVAATLIGLFLVGVFFYVEGGLRRWNQARDEVESYLRAATRFTLIAFTIPLSLSLTLVALEPFWARVVFVPLGLLLLVTNVDTLARIRRVARVTGSTTLVVNDVATATMSLVVAAAPWILGGLRPSREDLTWAILLAFAAGFVSLAAIVMSTFLPGRQAPSARRNPLR
jgi:hypothetical protein